MSVYNVYRVTRRLTDFQLVAGPFATQAAADACTQAMASGDHADIAYCTVQEGADLSGSTPQTKTTYQKLSPSAASSTSTATNPKKH